MLEARKRRRGEQRSLVWRYLVKWASTHHWITIWNHANTRGRPLPVWELYLVFRDVVCGRGSSLREAGYPRLVTFHRLVIPAAQCQVPVLPRAISAASIAPLLTKESPPLKIPLKGQLHLEYHDDIMRDGWIQLHGSKKAGSGEVHLPPERSVAKVSSCGGNRAHI